MKKRVPPPSAELIRKYSHARVVAPSKKTFVTGIDFFTGRPNAFSREMTDADVRESMVRKYR